jgi:hypothetical protein
MAAIVATLLYLPAAALLALVAQFTGLSFHAFMTFGGTLNTFSGLAAWWLVAFAGACIYAVFAFPWQEKVLAWPKKN